METDSKFFSRPGELTTRVYREPLYHRPVNNKNDENDCFGLLRKLIDTYGENATMGSIRLATYKEE